MRGRSNVGGGVSVNGTEVDKVVATGKTVKKGDFVEYYTVEHSTALTGAASEKNLQYDSTHWLMLINSYLYMVKIENGAVTIENSYMERPVLDFVVKSGDIIVASNSVVIALGYNNGFSQKSIVSTDEKNDGAVCVGDYIVTVSYRDTYSIIYKLFTYSSASLSLVKTYTYNSSSTKIDAYVIASGSKIFITSSSGNYLKIVSNEVANGDFTEANTTNVYIGSISTLSKPINVGSNIAVNDDYYFFYINTSTLNVTITTFLSLGITNYNRTVKMGYMDNDNMFVYSDTVNGLCICKYNLSTNILSRQSNILKVISNGYGICGSGFVAVTCSNKIRLLQLSDDKSIVSDYPDENYVQPYSDGSHTIGVAKNSGNAGDTVTVIVP